ncbi:hypothetical protein BD293_0062 [Roseinatronobacter monicus]|uniref:Uncharacterized protein n=1 Tax=Roseinatronobacter monicus TaxID=393481 RepID=A0A543K8U8_9RHOB|nr:hypothetical protein BD293_0062 [Roseinatronobacter monicus]
MQPRTNKLCQICEKQKNSCIRCRAGAPHNVAGITAMSALAVLLLMAIILLLNI